ncbi:MAG: DNA alkylation repair protein, partial [Muribaculaceae bacterium]|nr:DNA alkylation repair protein [Muribaculaceae bacterium]
MTEKAKEIEEIMIQMGDEKQAAHLMRFFKCAPGEYGYGDRFLGLKVPQTRSLVKECKSLVSIDDAMDLVKSDWHEVRLAGFLFLIELYKKAVKAKDKQTVENIVNAYIDHIPYGNNWDLVDLVAPKILGEYLVDHPEKRNILDDFSKMSDSLWHQRVAIVATWTLICNGIYEDVMRISKRYLNHSHDLIHKASGWMLREMGKRGGEKELRDFLDCYAVSMPRTMLRYAIERFPEQERQYYLKKQ